MKTQGRKSRITLTKQERTIALVLLGHRAEQGLSASVRRRVQAMREIYPARPMPPVQVARLLSVPTADLLRDLGLAESPHHNQSRPDKPPRRPKPPVEEWRRIAFGTPEVEAALQRLFTPPRSSAAEVARTIGVSPRALHLALIRRGWVFNRAGNGWQPPVSPRESPRTP